MSFIGKVVLVTGASSGIGRSTAIQFASLGASLALTGRNKENLNKVGEECSKLTAVQPFLITGEMTNDDDVVNILNSSVKHFGKLDVLVNNAGGGDFESILEPSLEIFDSIMRTNMRAIYLLTSMAVPHLEKTKGNIVNVSSLGGMRAFPGVLSYGIFRSALDQFTKCIALELAPKQIRVNSVNPGLILTPRITSRAAKSKEGSEDFLKRFASYHPLGRVGQPEEVAKAIAFLASDNASFTTGVLLPVDGGRHVACPR